LQSGDDHDDSDDDDDDHGGCGFEQMLPLVARGRLFERTGTLLQRLGLVDEVVFRGKLLHWPWKGVHQRV
jgi:hypothetical protein